MLHCVISIITVTRTAVGLLSRWPTVWNSLPDELRHSNEMCYIHCTYVLLTYILVHLHFFFVYIFQFTIQLLDYAAASVK